MSNVFISLLAHYTMHSTTKVLQNVQLGAKTKPTFWPFTQSQTLSSPTILHSSKKNNTSLHQPEDQSGGGVGMWGVGWLHLLWHSVTSWEKTFSSFSPRRLFNKSHSYPSGDYKWDTDQASELHTTKSNAGLPSLEIQTASASCCAAFSLWISTVFWWEICWE